VSTGELPADPEPRLAPERVEQHQREPRRRVAQGPWLVASVASVVKGIATPDRSRPGRPAPAAKVGPSA
jgi:hypothetical protein